MDLLERFLWMFCLISTTIPSVNPLNILLFIPGYSNSHIIFNYGLAETLMKYGHNKHEDVPNARILLQGLAWKDPDLSDLKELGDTVRKSWGLTCELQINSEESHVMLEELKRIDLDVVVGYNMNLCPLALANMIGAGEKFVWYSPGIFILEYSAFYLGFPLTPTFIPSSSGKLSDRMTFRQRLGNMVWLGANLMGAVFPSLLSDEDDMFRGQPNQDRPSLFDLSRQVPGIFINGEQAIDFPRPTALNMHYLGQVGGKGKKDGKGKKTGGLTEEWLSIINEGAEEGSRKGVVIFSLGTIANTTEMPDFMSDALFGAFKRMTDHTIVWRIEKEIVGAENYPHIHIVKYLPQRDLLQHPRTKLFITHGGYNSLLETTKAGIPVVLVPLFFDQFANAYRAVRHGLGKVLDRMVMTDDDVFEACQAVLTDSSFATRAKTFSRLLDDHIMPPDDLLNYRMRQIARAGKHGPTLQSGTRLNFVQYHCLDVLGLFVFLLYLSVKIGIWDSLCDDQLSEEECRALGFTPSLQCSTCQELLNFNLNSISDDCDRCCTKESNEGATKGSCLFWIVSVSPWIRLNSGSNYQCISAFIKSPMVNKWPGLEVKYARGADPTIKLIDDEGEVQETLNIEAWNTDTIVEFLSERLQQ